MREGVLKRENENDRERGRKLQERYRTKEEKRETRDMRKVVQSCTIAFKQKEEWERKTQNGEEKKRERRKQKMQDRQRMNEKMKGNR